MSVTTGTFPGVRIVDMPDLGTITDNSSLVGEHAGSGRFSAPALRAYATTGADAFVTTIAALRALTSGAAAVSVQGYRAAGDGGGGYYTLGATATDNGGSVIVSASGTYYLQTQGAPYSVRQFGARGDGVTDDTAAFQAAVNAASVNPGEVYVPPGNYLVGAVAVANPVRVLGAGLASSIWPLTTTTTVFTVSTVQPVVFEDLSFGYFRAVEQAAGSAIVFDTGSGTQPNGYSRVLRCTFAKQFLPLDFVRANFWIVDGCSFQECLGGVRIRNSAAEDTGCGWVTNCYFEQDASQLTGGVNVGVGIDHQSGGGLIVTNNRILGYQYGYALTLNLLSIASTSDLIIAHNSFEINATAAIVLQQGVDNTKAFANVHITDNQIAYCKQGIILAAGTGANTWLSKWMVCDNLIEVAANQGPAIWAQTGQTGQITGNVLTSEGGTGSGIRVDSAGAIQGVFIGADNVYLGFTTKLDVGAGAAVVAQPRFQSGVVTGTTASAYGASLFQSGAVHVDFRTPFFSPPAIVCAPSGSAGGVCVATENITPTGFDAICVGIANATAYTFAWMAAGI